MKVLNQYVFTFCTDGGPHPGGCYTVIEAETRGEARTRMFELWGREWAFQYDSFEDAGVDRFQLTFVPSPKLEVSP